MQAGHLASTASSSTAVTAPTAPNPIPEVQTVLPVQYYGIPVTVTGVEESVVDPFPS